MRMSDKWATLNCVQNMRWNLLFKANLGIDFRKQEQIHQLDHFLCVSNVLAQ